MVPLALHHRRIGRGFTLVELLIVVSIIALLIALLLPVLAQGRIAGYRAQCLSNLRQMGIGMTAYANEFQQWAPDSYTVLTQYTPEQVEPNGAWMLKLAPYRNYDPASLDIAWSADGPNYAPTKMKLLQ